VKDAVPHTFNRQSRHVQGQNTSFQLSEIILRCYHCDARTWTAISLGRPSVYPTIWHRSEEAESVHMHQGFLGDTARLKPPAQSTANADCSERETHLKPKAQMWKFIGNLLKEIYTIADDDFWRMHSEAAPLSRRA
jgi:hypothetical protein